MSRFRKPKPVVEENSWIKEHVDNLSTAPFQQLLAIYLSAAPSLDEIRRWAALHPDKYALSALNLARCANMVNNKELPNVTINMNFNAMSDSQIQQQMVDAHRRLADKGLLPHLPQETLDTVVAHQVQQAKAH